MTDKPDLSHLRPDTRAIRAGIERSDAHEMSEALQLTQGYVYESAAQAERVLPMVVVFSRKRRGLPFRWWRLQGSRGGRWEGPDTPIHVGSSGMSCFCASRGRRPGDIRRLTARWRNSSDPLQHACRLLRVDRGLAAADQRPADVDRRLVGHSLHGL